MTEQRTAAPIVILAALLFAAPACATAGESRPAPILLGPGVTAENMEDPFDYFANSWTTIGLKDHPSGTRISPRGELVLGSGITLRPLVGKTLLPLRPGIKATLRKGWLPIVKYDFIASGAVRYTIEAFACPISDDPKEFDRPSGDDFLNFLRVTLANVGEKGLEAVAAIERRPEAAPSTRPAGRDLRISAGGAFLGELRLPPVGRASAEGSRIVLRADLAPKASARFDLVLPYLAHRDPPAALLGAIEGADFDARLASTEAWWEGLAGRGAKLSVPEDKVRETWLVSLVQQFIGRDRGAIHAGEGFYDEMYLRDGAYQSLSLAHAGFLEEARESLDLLLRFRKPDGQLVSQSGQLDANGYGMWAPVEMAKLTGDLEWLRKAYPAIRGAAEWAMKARRTEKDPTSPFSGVLPAAIADGEYLWAGKNHILGYDWWNLRGIGCVAEAARMLGEKADAERFGKEYEEYRAAILKALDRTGLPFIPPSYEKEGTHWGNLEVVFPTPLLAPRDPRVTATLAHVRNEFGAPEGPKGFVEGVMQWSPATGAIHPYMSQFVTNTLASRGETEEAIDGLYSFLLHTTSTHSFPEGVYPRKREAWGNTIPHLWAAALYVTTLRNLLIREEGNDLHLLSAAPGHWLEPGKETGLAGAPTRFGTFSFLARGEAGSIRVSFEGAGGRPPARIVVHAPRAIRILSAECEGKIAPLEGGAAILTLGPAFKGIAVLRIERDRSAPPRTFAAKVAAYEAEAADRFRPIPGLLAAPPVGFDPKGSVFLDLSGVATTSPLDAPFRVSGAPAFTGLPIGDLEVGGIPFRTVDPAKNGGKGIVVLDGAESCKGLPREAAVPAGSATGRFLCILGAVTGWAPGDPGIGAYGAVAEVEVRYAGGGKGSIPIVPGRTADDWLGEPDAAEAAAVLRMGHWHMNVLVAALEAKPVESVVLRDLGTPSAPVFAALTIIR